VSVEDARVALMAITSFRALPAENTPVSGVANICLNRRGGLPRRHCEIAKGPARLGHSRRGRTGATDLTGIRLTSALWFFQNNGII
jgi:hypothetical protein